MTSQDADPASAQSRSRWYWLFSRALGEQPELPLLGELALALADADATGELGGCVIRLRSAIDNVMSNPLALTGAQVDYARLLGSARRQDGPEPFESMVREGRLFGAAAEEVAGLYAHAGFRELTNLDWPADHVSTELRFIALLSYEESTALSSNDKVRARTLVEHQLEFLRCHLLTWLPQFCDELAAMATSPLYHAVPALIAKACTGDLEDLERLLHAA